MSTFDNPFDPQRRLNRSGCSCGRHATQGDHERDVQLQWWDAAAEVWRQKASHHSGAFDFSTDNHSVTRSQVYKHCLEMAQYYQSQSGDSVVSVPMYRSDMR